MFEDIILRTDRAIEPIDNIINALTRLLYEIFKYGGNGYMKSVVDTIMNNPYLLVSLSLIFCGFVIGIIKRLISL